MLKEHVFSTQFVMRSSCREEKADIFYARVRKCLYEYVSHVGSSKVSGGSGDAFTVPYEAFSKLGVSCKIRRLQWALDVQETNIGSSRVFLLRTSEPKENQYYKEASDHSLFVETIVHTFRDLFGYASLRITVHSWVEYQPFAGFTKTQRLPRAVPAIVDWLAEIADAELLFEPRWVSTEERESDPELRTHRPMFYPICRDYKVVSDEQTLCNFREHLEDPFRPIPLVVFFGDSMRHIKEANQLVKRCWIKCRVWVLHKDTEGLADVLKSAILGIDVRKNFRWGLCRIFFPRGLYRQDDAAQPWHWVPFLCNHHFRKRTTIGLLRFYHFDESGGWLTSQKDLLFAKYESLASMKVAESDKNVRMMNAIVKQMIAERNNAHRNREVVEKDLERAIRDIDIVKEENAKIQESSKELLNESTDAIEERDRLLAENVRLKAGVQRLLGQKGDKGGYAVSDCAPVLFAEGDAPINFETLTWVAPRIFTGLAFSEKAWDNMKRKSNNKRFVVDVWRMLWNLEHVLLPMLVDPSSSCNNPAKKFYETTGYQYSSKDSSDLPPDMDRERNIVFDGKKWRIEPHIKNGNRDATLIRIYFAIDKDNMRLIIGSIGDHLPNLGTLKNS